MGMLYYECEKCKGCIAIQGQLVGFVKCENCKHEITHCKNRMFAKKHFKCLGCNLHVSFDSNGKATAMCVKCDIPIPELKMKITKYIITS